MTQDEIIELVQVNEQIERLAEQADKWFEEDGHSYSRSAWNEKFAELIVRECIRVPYDMWDKAELNADIAVKIEHRIKQHFGVEE